MRNGEPDAGRADAVLVARAGALDADAAGRSQVADCRNEFRPIGSPAGLLEELFHQHSARVLGQNRQQPIPAIRHLSHVAP
jgi:hypothetical protein